jgi:drug/metabolite transporter (DMT)-like permease
MGSPPRERSSLPPLFLALVAAVLFGSSAPASKVLLEGLMPFQLAGLLYLGAALGVAPWVLRERRSKRRNRMSSANRRRLAVVVLFGGVLGPVLLLFALRSASAASVSLLLNLEMVATALLGVAFFGEHLGRSGFAGAGVTVLAGVMLSLGGGTPGLVAGVLAAGACVCWAVDNNLTALIDGLSPAETTLWKGAVAGSTNLFIGLQLAPLPASPGAVGIALLVGAISYGVSLVLYITAAQQLGATRSQVAFATAPFAGALISFVFLGETIGAIALLAGVLLVVGLVLSFLDRHAHQHTHEACEHIHSHRHDDGHHDHEHGGLAPSTQHTHEHRHELVVHAHRHLPDLHHRHRH